MPAAIEPHSRWRMPLGRYVAVTRVHGETVTAMYLAGRDDPRAPVLADDGMTMSMANFRRCARAVDAGALPVGAEA